ncbi:uncharacterized protein LOC123578721 [Leopardus geoffroyi]|uniref:uncharacterized protein LOC123578721 n=1 Tax=Leopardus geoffroyi TaxID=46844 RepID=UPI001E25F96A|nr:uncharacterized protein LOC123578721 [Leopardus geoffroyi]
MAVGAPDRGWGAPAKAHGPPGGWGSVFLACGCRAAEPAQEHVCCDPEDKSWIWDGERTPAAAGSRTQACDWPRRQGHQARRGLQSGDRPATEGISGSTCSPSIFAQVMVLSEGPPPSAPPHHKDARSHPPQQGAGWAISSLGANATQSEDPWPRLLDTERGGQRAFKRLYWGNVQGWRPSLEIAHDAVLQSISLGGCHPRGPCSEASDLGAGAKGEGLDGASQLLREGPWLKGASPLPARDSITSWGRGLQFPRRPGATGSFPDMPLGSGLKTRVTRLLPKPQTPQRVPRALGPGATHRFWRGPRL